MWKILKDLYQNSSDQRKLALKDKLQKIKCKKGDIISTFLNKLTTCRYDLGSIGIMTANDDMEEIRRSTKDGSSSKQDDEENLALASKAKKGKGKASQSKSSHGGKKVEKSKVRCFHCHEMGHYAMNYPQKKSKKGSSKGSDGDALASQFELDFSLITCMVSSMVGCVWDLDSGASFHMLGEGTVAFQREHGAPLTLSTIKYLPGLKKNLVSISMLEDKGYDVVFSKGKVFLRHINTGQTMRIGIQVKNLYKLEVDDCAVLSSKAEVVQSQDIGEMWHRRLGHLHHEALNVMQQSSIGLPKGKLEQTDT
eukprot:PITA_26878